MKCVCMNMLKGKQGSQVQCCIVGECNYKWSLKAGMLIFMHKSWGKFEHILKFLHESDSKCLESLVIKMLQIICENTFPPALIKYQISSYPAHPQLKYQIPSFPAHPQLKYQIPSFPAHPQQKYQIPPPLPTLS